ncbi:hypothetical protein ABIE56_002859 [Luteibacter sp. 621]|jgi:hypothetical protein|uniref:energy transducer TonB n=1 Tax=Luteibacter sp. 621 TaxID=3373916 RepID=UPI003D257437
MKRDLKVGALLIVPMLASVASATDCGASKYSEVINETRSLIASSRAVPMVRGEISTPAGTRECVRVSFKVGISGRPYDIDVAESSGHIVYNREVVSTLERYTFKASLWSIFSARMLVFDNVVDQFPVPEPSVPAHP